MSSEKHQTKEFKEACRQRMLDKWKDKDYRNHMVEVHKGQIVIEKHIILGGEHGQDNCNNFI